MGLLLGLQDARFEVRFNCGRSLDAVKQRVPETEIPEEAVHAILECELSVLRTIWESYRLLDRREAGEEYEFLDDNLRERANQSMEHVFSLLALVLPREPLRSRSRRCTPTTGCCAGWLGSIWTHFCRTR